MRTTPMIIAAAALFAASPALAQNEATNTTNVTETNVVEMNATANVAATVPTPAEPVALPGDNVTNETAPAPEPAKRSFPWGIIGVLGLLGLIPRSRR